MPRQSVIQLPELLKRKIYKSGQTRGADDDVIYQNRVGRTSTVLIPYQFWDETREKANNGFFEHGYIVLIKPEDYFSLGDVALSKQGLKLGSNCLVFYETRKQWTEYDPAGSSWIPAHSRTSPLGGQYVARVPATTSVVGGSKINRGYTETSMKGAGIRLYEYATTETIGECKTQLEAIYWLCKDSIEAAVSFGMNELDAIERKERSLSTASVLGLLDFDRLIDARIINEKHETVCPLCLECLSAFGFYNRLAQAEGREVPDITVTEINLFHIDELRYGQYNHRPYNLGWGHHHCNVVVKDAGIIPTLQWMKKVVIRNEDQGTIIEI